MNSPLEDTSDELLLEMLEQLVRTSNQVTAQLLLHIGEADARKLYAQSACSSMFSYCVTCLGLSEPASYKRIHAARATRSFPILLELLAAGRLHLVGIVLLAPHLTQENQKELLQACGSSKTDPRSPSGRCRATCPRGRHRRTWSGGLGPSCSTTRKPSPAWTSSPCPPRPSMSCRCSSSSATTVGVCCISGSPAIRRRPG